MCALNKMLKWHSFHYWVENFFELKFFSIAFIFLLLLMSLLQCKWTNKNFAHFWTNSHKILSFRFVSLQFYNALNKYMHTDNAHFPPTLLVFYPLPTNGLHWIMCWQRIYFFCHLICLKFVYFVCRMHFSSRSRQWETFHFQQNRHSASFANSRCTQYPNPFPINVICILQ